MFGRNPITKNDPRATGETLRVQEIFPTIQGEGPFAGQPAVFLRLQGCNLRCTFCDTDFESSDWVPDLDRLVETLYMAVDHVKTELLVITGGEPMIQNLMPLLNRLWRDATSHVRQVFDTVQIETAGTVWQDFPLGFGDKTLEELVYADFVHLVCSPKTGKVHQKVLQNCKDWKYVIRADHVSTADGLPNVTTQPVNDIAAQGLEHSDDKIQRPPVTQGPQRVWVQPCEEYKEVRVAGPFKVESKLFPFLTHVEQQTDDKATRRNIDKCVRVAMEFGYRVSLQQHKILGVR